MLYQMYYSSKWRWSLNDFSLDDQTQVDLKLVGQPEHASLNQCQLIAP